MPGAMEQPPPLLARNYCRWLLITLIFEAPNKEKKHAYPGCRR